ncbi:hypothetical protein JIG36_23730 [Actinoplanes sp. LDG1-06]|uniref:Uncharacterized protein n=1 Tax=Paractinoplanes ovalisporus TaxID=2810368 RepID=A0ABS2AFH5_9ACTN|nr:hypothetical protein [Actinoplanes ovalisporus]MBM2618571.1 hypothetical protein [Actinoplanes ovalisporus]
MELQLSGVDADDLGGWLVSEPDLRPLVNRVRSTPRPGELGALEVLTIAVGSGGVLTVLAGSLNAWLSQARNRTVRLKVSLRNGPIRQIELDATNTDASEIEKILRGLGDGPS